jgi:hypothetical protein
MTSPGTIPWQRILFVAPSDSGLEVTPELDGLYDAPYDVLTLQGTVDRSRLFNAVRRREFDILHFSTHANRDGVLLSAGELLDATGILQLARACRATLVFLNNCESAELGQVLIDEDVPAVICTLSNISDILAKETSQVFYRALARLQDYRLAYHESKPPIKGGYIFLTDGRLPELQFAPILHKLEELTQMITRDQAEHTTLEQQITQVGHRQEELSEEIGALRMTVGDFEKLKRWLIEVFGVIMGLSLLIQIIITFVGQAR